MRMSIRFTVLWFTINVNRQVLSCREIRCNLDQLLGCLEDTGRLSRAGQCVECWVACMVVAGVPWLQMDHLDTTHSALTQLVFKRLPSHCTGRSPTDL